MLCPKCGREYDGTKCPNCDGPDIIINQEDYLKRRKEYEEKQAVLKSASSDNEETNKSNEGLRPDEILDKIVKAGEQARKKITDKKDEKKEQEKKKSKKTRLIAVISLFAVIVVLLGIYKLTNHKDKTLYSIYDDTIYHISQMDTKQVCKYNEAIFESDKNAFHIQSLPQDYRDRTVKESMSSDNGKYYSASIYDDNSTNYSILIWNGEHCNILAQNNKEKKLLYIDNDGYVIYQEIEVINEEGSVGTTQLYISKVESEQNVTTTLLSENVKNIYVYSDEKTVIFNESEGELYTYVYGKNSKKVLIAQDVTTVYGAVKDTIHLFSYKAQQVNTLKNCNGFIYKCNDSIYYYQLDFSDSRSIYLGNNSSTNLTYIVEQDEVIMIDKGVLMSAKIADKKVEEYTEIAKLASDNMIYDDDSKSILFINENNSLLYRSKGKITTISEEVTDGTLNFVVNAKGAFTYVCKHIQVYCKNVKAHPVNLTEEGNLARDSEIFYQKGKLYFINTQEKLYACNDNGTDGSVIGDASRIICNGYVMQK